MTGITDVVTGEAGYMGSHTPIALLAAGHKLCVFDNVSNSSPAALARLRHLTSRGFSLVEADDLDALTRAAAAFARNTVIHFCQHESRRRIE